MDCGYPRRRILCSDIDSLVATIKEWGAAGVEFVETRNAPFIPAALKLPFMIGGIGLIKGRKWLFFPL